MTDSSISAHLFLHLLCSTWVIILNGKIYISQAPDCYNDTFSKNGLRNLSIDLHFFKFFPFLRI